MPHFSPIDINITFVVYFRIRTQLKTIFDTNIQIKPHTNVLKQLLYFVLHHLSFYRGGAIHSPFVFELYNEVVRSRKYYYFFDQMNQLRKKLRKSKEIITVTDFGAGSKVFSSNRRKVKDILRHSVSKPKKSELIFKLVDYFKPAIALELGACLGVNAVYMAGGSQNTYVLTLEGCPNTATMARKIIRPYQRNIQIIEGKIEDTLAPLLKKLPSLDFVFLDANHTRRACLNYFEQCMNKAAENSIFVVDDIYWSEEMRQAWRDIKAHQKIRLTIDLFDIGIAFLRDKQSKQHFLLRY